MVEVTTRIKVNNPKKMSLDSLKFLRSSHNVRVWLKANKILNNLRRSEEARNRKLMRKINQNKSLSLTLAIIIIKINHQIRETNYKGAFSIKNIQTSKTNCPVVIILWVLLFLQVHARAELIHPFQNSVVSCLFLKLNRK